MKHRLLLIALVLIMGICLISCEHYEQEDVDRITAKGTELMQTWLEENMPDAEMIECSAFINSIKYSSQKYLVDYATGRIVHNGEEAAFAIDTVTGDVYFENDQSVEEKLNEIAADFFYETMGIIPEGCDDSFTCYVLAPFRDENHELKAYHFDPQQDLVLEKTETGYRYYLPNEDWREGFYIYAHEGAEMLEDNYNWYVCGDVERFIENKYDFDEQECVELVWKKLYNGDYVLTSKKDGVSRYFSHAGTLEPVE